MDAAEASKTVGEILITYLKTGPTLPEHGAQIRGEVLDLVCSVMAQPGEVSARYARTSGGFLASVRKVKGMPTRVIRAKELEDIGLVSSSGQAIADRFDELLPLIERAYDRCMANHESQAAQYFADQLVAFSDLLGNFLASVPAGGSKDPEIRKKITEIKREVKALAKWDGLFGIYKAASLPAAMDHLMKLEEAVIAVEWSYSSLDEQGEYRKTYNHRPRHGRIFLIRGNWAEMHGLIKVGDYGYLDEIDLPRQEVGCSCNLTYLTSLRDLPTDMLSAAGRDKLGEMDAIREEFRRTDKIPTPTQAPPPA